MPTDGPGATKEFYRGRLIERMTAPADLRVIAAVAPAGYGKSTVVRQYARTMSSSTVCDCMGMRTAADLAHGIATALARDDAERTAALSQQRLGDAADGPGWATFALSSWSQPSAHPLFVFENTEHILDSVETIELLSHALARLPEDRSVAICSRRALPMPLSRFAPPHRVLTLRSEDLRFDVDELKRFFSQAKVSDAAIGRIAEITHGWPIAVLLLARLARQGPIEPMLRHLRGVPFEDLHDYLAEQVLATMSPRMFARLVAIAAIPNATADDVAIALDEPDVSAELAELTTTSPFVYAVAESAYEAHPIVRATLWERHRDACHRTLRAAVERLAPAAPLRAAQLCMALGDRDAAATLLENASELFVTDVPVIFAEIVGQLDAETLLRHPGVWAAATAVRATNMSDAQWLHEALVARDNLKPTTPLSVRVGVNLSLGNVLLNLGRHDEAYEAFASIDRHVDVLPERYHAVREFFLAGMLARQGRFAEAEARWRDVEPLFAGVKFTRSIMLEEVTVRAARFRGDRVAERAALETAVALARAAYNALAIALTLEESAFAAWFAGEDDVFQRYVRDLEAAIVPTTARATEVFRGCARGDFTALRRHELFEHPKMRFYAALIGCAFATGNDRAEIARIALEGATSAGEPMSVAIAAVTCAESIPEQREAMLAQAKASCATVDSEALARAVNAYAVGDADCGILTPLLARLRSRPSSARAFDAPRLHVSVVTATVSRSGVAVALPNRELELVAYLATRGRPCSREEVVEALWPESENFNVLRVYANRARSRLGDADAILSVDGGYRLHPDVGIDLTGIELTIQRAREQSLPLEAPLRAELQAAYVLLSRERPPAVALWNWFGPVEIRIQELAREASVILGRDALRRGEVNEARAIAQRMIEFDPCDEPARELLIRVHLASDDRASALREFRIYRETLASELGAEPSAALEALVTRAPDSTRFGQGSPASAAIESTAAPVGRRSRLSS